MNIENKSTLETNLSDHTLISEKSKKQFNLDQIVSIFSDSNAL